MPTWIATLSWKWIACGIAVVALVATVAIHFRTDAKTRAALAALRDEAQIVVLATQAASGNDRIDWQTAPGQIIALGESNRALKASITEQNAAIDELARRAVAAKARAAELQEIADRAQAQRQSALRKLSNLTITPGTRTDCMQLLQEAEAALDITYQAARGD